MGVFTSLLEEVVHSMLSKIVSLACVALTAGQVQIEGSPEWQAYKNAELAHIAPSIGPLAGVGRNFAQEQLLHQQNALNFIASGAGRRKRQVPDWQKKFVAGTTNWQANFVAGTPNWQANFVAGTAGRRKRQVPNWQANYAGSSDWQANFAGNSDWQANYAGNSDWTANFAGNSDWEANFVAGAGRRKRQVQVEGSPEWQAYKNAELAFIAPSVGPTPVNHAQSALNFIAPAPGPSPVSFAQATLNYQQEALNFIASGLGK